MKIEDYRCDKCGCTSASWEMGGFWIGFHYEGCPDWDRYVNAGPQPKQEKAVEPPSVVSPEKPNG